MKVVLRDDVETLGQKGDVVDVADGYARNYLVPRGLGMVASRGVVAQAESMRRSRAAREARDRTAAEAVATQLVARRIAVSARAGESGKLFGSVTAADIVEALAAQSGINVDRRKLSLDEPIRELGATEVTIRLHTDVVVTVGVDVVAE
jgi:large subunit ribosomal protein L9